VLHIGAMKTGTTFLQQLLADHRATLESHGLKVPRDQGAGLRSILAGAHRPGHTGRQARMSRRLLDAVQEYDGSTSLLSWEFLSFLDPEVARRLLDDLGVEVDVVLGVRDAARTMPAQWQTRCRNGTTIPWARFAPAIGAWLESGRTSHAARVFERTQGVPRMLDVWTDLLGADRVRVITVPRAAEDPLLLWRRFAEAAGVDPSLAVKAGVRHNPSLGYPSCELLRRINEAFDPELPDDCGRLIRAVVAPDLEARAGSEARIRLDGPGLAVASAWNKRTVEAIRTAGVRVVGDLDGDLPTTPPADAGAVPPPTDEDLLEAAATARASLVGLGAPAASARPTDVDAAIHELATMIRETAGIDLTAARRERGRGRQ
jgi:hypothetical protein